jgi:spore coat protein H
VTVREGRVTYTNVLLHLKGAAGSFRPVADNPAMTLHFDKQLKGQRFHGLSKLSLNNSVQDPTFVSEELCRELFLKAGIPAPRATHALVQLNGRDLGLYVLTEGWDRQFLRRHFKKTGGNLYDGGFLKDVTDELMTNSGNDPKNQADRQALADAVKEPNLTNRLARLEKVLDVDRFLTFVALEVMLWDWDGYAMNRNNWRLYHDLDKDRLVFMPHGMDQMFWKPKGSIFPPMQGLVARAALEIPALRTRYFERLQQLRASVFQPAEMTNRAHEISRTFEPVLRVKSPAKADEQAAALVQLCSAIEVRGRSLDEQLAHAIEPLKFDSAGLASLTHWESKADFGFPVLTQTHDDEALLQIGTQRGSSIGSWRTSVWLEKGKYRLEGRLKTQGIVADPGDPRAGAGVRLGSNRPLKYILGDSDWKPLDYEFTIADSLSEVQLVCEFRGSEGQAVFDARSLHLKRVASVP